MNTVRLGDIADLKSGQNLSKKNIVEGPYAVIGGGSPKGFHESFNRPKNTITIGSVGAYAGKTHFWKNPIFMSDNGFSVCLKSKDDLDNRFLYYSLISLQDVLFGLVNQTAQPYIRKSDVANVMISWPDADRRAEIVAEMQKIEAAKEALQQTEAALDNLYKSRLHEAFQE